LLLPQIPLGGIWGQYTTAPADGQVGVVTRDQGRTKGSDHLLALFVTCAIIDSECEEVRDEGHVCGG
jgi:hypothetical protein